MDMKSTILDAKETKAKKNMQKVENSKDDTFEKKIKRENLWWSSFFTLVIMNYDVRPKYGAPGYVGHYNVVNVKWLRTLNIKTWK